MKYILLVAIFQLFYLNNIAQKSFYDHVVLGKHQINYSDTIIYDSEIQYNQFGYSGDAPLFVQIWFPSENKSTTKYSKFGDLTLSNVPSNLAGVYKELQSQMDEAFIQDCIKYNIGTDEPIAYKEHTITDILELIKLKETKSVSCKLPSKLNYPVIVYHHGSQGLSYENSIMAEYFSSHGYIFISANFHLPYENTVYGLLPYNLEKENKHNQSSVKTLVNFAKSLNSQNQLFYIGHSWGAQEGWCFLNDSKWADAFISMETTIEYKTDLEKIKEMWPYVYDAIKVKKNRFSIPILAFAAADESINFEFFKGLNSEETIFASYKKPFGHNSYTSLYMMRYFLNNTIIQPDSELLLSQIKGFNEHIKMSLMFFESIIDKKRTTTFNNVEDFKIERISTNHKSH